MVSKEYRETGTRMGISERRRRGAAVASLAGFVVAFGFVSWYVTGGTRPHSAPVPRGALVSGTQGAVPMSLGCAATEIELAGAFGECVKPVDSPSGTCSVTGHVLEAAVLLGHGSPDAWFYIEIDGAFDGAGTYDLSPWPHPLGTRNDPPKIALEQDGSSESLQRVNGVPIEQYGTDNLWQSVAGNVTVTGSNGRSGTVAAILEMSAGHNATAPGTTLTVSGKWRCP
jgi:hypothetical protein